jgi:CubicO group peptidase (beta-lactamase class C family)
VTSVAIVQHIEHGQIDLDDPDIVHRNCPELDKRGILEGFDSNGQPKMRPRKGKFTLRHLLAHTSGMGYPRLNAMLGQWEDATGHPRFWEGSVDSFNKPTLFEPGTAWEYGLGIDWAGIVLERVAGRTLEDIFQKDIFRPLGISSKELSFYPNENTVPRLQLVCRRNDAGEIIHSVPIVNPDRTPEEIGQLAGGGGLFGTAPAYLRFLRGVLASARGDGSGLVSPDGYKLLFANCLPPPGENNTCTEDIYIGAGEQVSNDPAHRDLGRMEHSIAFPMTTVDSPHGRKAGSGAWGGAGQTLYWIDPKADVAVSDLTTRAN